MMTLHLFIKSDDRTNIRNTSCLWPAYGDTHTHKHTGTHTHAHTHRQTHTHTHIHKDTHMHTGTSLLHPGFPSDERSAAEGVCHGGIWPNSCRICFSVYYTKESSGVGWACRVGGSVRGGKVRRSCHPVKVGYKM